MYRAHMLLSRQVALDRVLARFASSLVVVGPCMSSSALVPITNTAGTQVLADMLVRRYWLIC
jgi:hypothetical protein